MDSRKWFKIIVVAIGLLFFAFVLADSLGLFSSAPYTAVPHGDHVHYVPNDRDPDVPLGQFPTVEPRPGEIITPDGEVVPDRSTDE
jgi:hypothetical protein